MKNVIKAVIAVVVLAGVAGATDTKWNVDVFGGAKFQSAPTSGNGAWRLIKDSNVWKGDGMPVVESDGNGKYKIDGVAVETGYMEFNTVMGKTRLCGDDSLMMLDAWGLGHIKRNTGGLDAVEVKKLTRDYSYVSASGVEFMSRGYRFTNASGQYLDMFINYDDDYTLCVLKGNASGDSYKMLVRAASLMLTYFFGTGIGNYTAN